MEWREVVIALLKLLMVDDCDEERRPLWERYMPSSYTNKKCRSIFLYRDQLGNLIPSNGEFPAPTQPDTSIVVRFHLV